MTKDKFICWDCKKQFPKDERSAMFTASLGDMCSACWGEFKKEIANNGDKVEKKFNDNLEDKIRKIVNKVLDERGIK